ncbi:hypothetical protein, partial [Sporosarcina sp. SAFN-015]|uniref:hypothetical protein n=1 Tax=Sporosarcina sp. SAFN-015 TaxID=3387274 RepID=UPI003F80A6C6
MNAAIIGARVIASLNGVLAIIMPMITVSTPHAIAEVAPKPIPILTSLALFLVIDFTSSQEIYKSTHSLICLSKWILYSLYFRSISSAYAAIYFDYALQLNKKNKKTIRFNNQKVFLLFLCGLLNCHKCFLHRHCPLALHGYRKKLLLSFFTSRLAVNKFK